MTDKPNYSLKDLLNELKSKEEELLKWDIQFIGTRFTEILQAEISALKKGISACEEIFNSQHRDISTKANELYSTTDISVTSHNVCLGDQSPHVDNTHQGNICCQGCYRLGLKDGQESMRKECFEVVVNLMEVVDNLIKETQNIKEILINQSFNHYHTEDCKICECIDRLEQLSQSQQHEDLPAMGRTEVSLGNGNPKHNSPADTQFQNNLNNTSTNLNLNKGCGKKVLCDGININYRCGDNFKDGKTYCDDCKKLKAVKNSK